MNFSHAREVNNIGSELIPGSRRRMGLQQCESAENGQPGNQRLRGCSHHKTVDTQNMGVVEKAQQGLCEKSTSGLQEKELALTVCLPGTERDASAAVSQQSSNE